MTWKPLSIDSDVPLEDEDEKIPEAELIKYLDAPIVKLSTVPQGHGRSDVSASKLSAFLSDVFYNDKHDKRGRFAPKGGGGDKDGGTGKAEGDPIAAIAKAKEEEAVSAEPELSAEVEEVAADTGAELEGFEFRIKGEASIETKIKGDVESGKWSSPQEAADHIYDYNRYTLVADDDHYTAMTQQAFDEFQQNGFTFDKVKNFWTVPIDRNPYQGINVQARDPHGHKLELQFHTPKSLEVKETALHRIYEQHRVGKIDDQDFIAQSQKIASGIPIPPGVRMLG